MKLFLLVIFLIAGCKPQQQLTIRQPAIQKTIVPPMFAGSFTDDYNIRYRINDSLWLQQPSIRYHILKWDTAAQYLICKNGNRNPSDKDLYTRIDYMTFTNMEPYR